MENVFARIAKAVGPCWLVLVILTAAAASANETDLVPRLQQGGHALMMRHAHAPGFGDPPLFSLDNCDTQRNLDHNGRAQAAAVGDWLRDRGIKSARVYSSQWCRCLETAQLLKLGPVTPLPALNSFFARPENRLNSLVALNAFLARQPADSPVIILVTHHVNLQAMTGFSVGSGEAVILQLQPGDAPRVVGRLDFGRADIRTNLK
jgi:hypothetical protein